GQFQADRGGLIVHGNGRSSRRPLQGQDVGSIAAVGQRPVKVRRGVSKDQITNRARRVKGNRPVGSDVKGAKIRGGVRSVCDDAGQPATGGSPASAVAIGPRAVSTMGKCSSRNGRGNNGRYTNSLSDLHPTRVSQSLLYRL